MEIQKLQGIDCTDKKILMRVDCNIAQGQLENETENFRLTLIKESVDHILSFSGARVSLLSHFGRPEGRPDQQYSLAGLRVSLEAILGEPIEFVSDCLTLPTFKNSRVALLENVRFYKEEEENDAVFAQRLAGGYDLYVNEAFSVSHRAHASVEAITRCLPSVAGIHLTREIETLEKALEAPERPAVAVLGGAKIETKLRLIHVFEAKYDTILLGGKIANEAIMRGMIFTPRVLFPTDFRDEKKLDIGDETAGRYQQIIKDAKTVIWNGPLGKFEEPPFDQGTNKIVQAIAETKAYTIAGGGESLAVIQKAGIFHKIDLVSSGGGAMLSFLAGENLPGLECLRKK
jgi:3-phosphoglycerate kinase